MINEYELENWKFPGDEASNQHKGFGFFTVESVAASHRPIPRQPISLEQVLFEHQQKFCSMRGSDFDFDVDLVFLEHRLSRIFPVIPD